MLVKPEQFPVIGHEWAVEQLAMAFNSGRNRHAYLISGPAAIGKSTLAKAIAMALNCTAPEGRPCGQCRSCRLIIEDKHPDLSVVQSEEVGSTLKIEQIRAMQHQLALRPYEGRYRVAIIKRFHEASNTAPDALLKTLEEPPKNVVIILTTEDASRLLATIRSRCQPYLLQPLRLQETEQALQQYWQADAEQAHLLARLSGGRIGWAVAALRDAQVLEWRSEQLDALERLVQGNRSARFSEIEGLTRAASKKKSDLLELLQLWQSYWRDALLLANGSSRWLTNVDRLESLQALVQQQAPEAFHKAVRATQQSQEYLRRNVNNRLALEAMVLDYPFSGRLT